MDLLTRPAGWRDQAEKCLRLAFVDLGLLAWAHEDPMLAAD
ncbi:hypothetical protein [Pseudonocardia oroxyli]|nr:hypothetical protein [Pseudonocardia oroxyli]